MSTTSRRRVRVKRVSQSMSRKQIGAPGNTSLANLTGEAERKAEIITGYLEDYASLDGRIVTPKQYDLYIEALRDLSLRQIEKGLKKYLQQGTRWPWPGTLREFCEEEI